MKQRKAVKTPISFAKIFLWGFYFLDVKIEDSSKNRKIGSQAILPRSFEHSRAAIIGAGS